MTATVLQRQSVRKQTDEKVLANYLNGERLKVIPRKRSRKLVVLNWLVERFAYGVDYPEAEVNALIAKAHPDYATLRRELYDAYLMDRENGVYRRRGQPEEEVRGRLTDVRAPLLADLRAYVPADERERAMSLRVVDFIERHPDAFERSQLSGHVTASAWIVDPSRTRALLLHHRKLGRWLQPGGHCDGDPDARASALREAIEETGAANLRAIGASIYDVDVHAIPARPGEPAHEHFDVRFAFEADPSEPLAGNAESHDVAWIPLHELPRFGADESVLRLARKAASLPPAEKRREPR